MYPYIINYEVVKIVINNEIIGIINNWVTIINNISSKIKNSHR